jgi:quercetin dioxygenase-like cupin family protein
MKIKPKSLLCVAVFLVVTGGLAIPLPGSAQDVAPSYKASPDVYKLISENEHFRVIMATWKPGQRDAWHAHAGPLAGYRLTDCKQRAYTPDGKFQERDQKRGFVNFAPVTASHSVENVGPTNCEVLIVEKK